MPLTFDIDTASRVVELTCGNTSIERWRAVMAAVMADPRFEPGYSYLVDCRTATRAPSAQDVDAVVAFIGRHAAALGCGRWAVVVAADAGYGMARMASIRGDAAGIQLVAFRDVEAARRWVTAEATSTLHRSSAE